MDRQQRFAALLRHKREMTPPADVPLADFLDGIVDHCCAPPPPPAHAPAGKPRLLTGERRRLLLERHKQEMSLPAGIDWDALAARAVEASRQPADEPASLLDMQAIHAETALLFQRFAQPDRWGFARELAMVVLGAAVTAALIWLTYTTAFSLAVAAVPAFWLFPVVGAALGCLALYALNRRQDVQPWMRTSAGAGGAGA